MAELKLHVHGMDCADEAALIRRAVAPLAGVERLDFDLVGGVVVVSFDEHRVSHDAIATAARRTGLPVHALAPADSGADADREEHAHHDHAAAHPHAHGHSRKALIAAAGLFLIGWVVEGAVSEHWFDTFVHHAHDARASAFYGAASLVALWPMLPRAIAALRYARLDMHVLVSLTVIGAAFIGEWSEGAAVAVLFALAHEMEAWSIERARTEVAALVGRGPALVAGGLQDSSPVERWIERFAGIYTPAVTAAAVVVAIVPPLLDGQWGMWFYRALVFLVLACPCALVISTPVTMVAALTSAARRGVLVKGGAALERAAGAAGGSRAALSAAGVTVAGVRDRAVDSADVVLTASEDRAIEFLIRHARRAMRVVRQNVAIALLTKAAFLVSAPFGFAPLWMAVLADTGATVIVTLNGLRLLRNSPR